MMKICPSCQRQFAAVKSGQIYCGRACVNRAYKRKFPVEYGCKSRLYRIWRAMHFRCYQPAHKAFARYNAKGIGVCQEWQSSYETFMGWALASGYSGALEIDRIDNSKGYSPNNCRWVTRSINQRNRDNSLPTIRAFGDERTPVEWAEDPRCAVPYRVLFNRLKHGWLPELALSTPPQHVGRPFGSQRRGEAASNAKLTVQQVREIRASSLSESQLGAKYGISPAAAGLVRRRRTWAHVE